LWHTSSHHTIIIFIFDFISLFLHAPRKSKLNFHFGCHYASFLTRSLGFLELFSKRSLECLWPPFTRSSLPPNHHKNHLIWGDSRLMVPLWINLALSAFGRLLRGPASCLTVPRTIWSEWTQSEQYPLAWSKIPFGCLFRTVDICNLLLCCTYIAFRLIVWFLCIILILEMYSRYFDPVTGNQHRSESINIIHHKIWAWFRLSIGFSKVYCHHSREPGYVESISPNWVKEGKTLLLLQKLLLSLLGT
jgi:hypothetical protein